MNIESYLYKILVPESYYWIPMVCLVLAFTIVIWQFICQWRYCYPENKRIKNLKLLASLMFLVWSVGFGLYMYAIAHNKDLGNAQTTGFELCFRSAAASFDMFTFGIDSDIVNGIINFPIINGLISLTAFIAGTLTIWLIISMFGARLWSSIKSLWSSLFTSDDELCIFFGINDPTTILAQSIYQKTENGSQEPDVRRFRLVFVEFPLKNDNEVDSGWTNFIKSITHRIETFRVAKKSHAHLSIANTALSRLHQDDNSEDPPVSSLLDAKKTPFLSTTSFDARA